MPNEQIEDVLIALRRVIRATDLYSRDLIKTSGLTAPQLLLMHTIKDSQDSTVSEIAGRMSLSQSTVTSILDRLEKRSYITREKSPQDKRKVIVKLTAQGIQRMKEAPTPLQQNFVEQFEQLAAWEQSMIIAALQRVADMMDARHLDASPVLDVGKLDREVSSENN